MKLNNYLKPAMTFCTFETEPKLTMSNGEMNHAIFNTAIAKITL